GSGLVAQSLLQEIPMEADPSWGQHRAMRPTLERALVMLLLAASIGACGTTIDLHKRAVQGVIDGQEVGALACGPGAFDPLGEPLRPVHRLGADPTRQGAARSRGDP